MAPYDLHYQPKDLIPNAVYMASDPELSIEEKETIKGVVNIFSPADNRELCRACGWNHKHELCSSYLPRLRVSHTRENSGLWTMGNDWVVWDRTDEECGNDYMTHQFLQKQRTKYIPLVKKMVEFKDEDRRYNFVVMSRAKGIPLENVWTGLSCEEKESYAQQMIAALRELRQFTAEFPQRVDGSPLWDNVIGNCDSRKMCKKVGKTAEDWINNMDEELREGISRQLKTRDKTAIDTRLQEIKKNFPDGAPYVLTHADLNMGNILVHAGKIEAIIDWELAGYYPWWVEIYTSYNRALSDAADELFDVVWRELDLDLDSVMDNLRPVMRAWGRCPVAHTGRTHIWQRPPFCQCQPFGGVIRKHLIDSEEKHFVNYDRPEWPYSRAEWREAYTGTHEEPKQG
ncbi:kinase-like protein [Cucurbitaria berberidis CBS 394.84]|uniref:Kinase-like protein n=1 Tax=Cucurbitaria berberidis CBS 394.84 TaxID=1168544 RepID=A0A9P4GFG0_9PLEO|nr:kinase-like protein [Cucurbitaria berberidis CBS 394.84]KAF1844469.1 kinase-like protein [Cucurbitaria berberidis CBS 394.84]